MKKITVLNPIDFLTYCLSLAEVVSENPSNYEHTHDRVRFDPESGILSAEEVCINEYGSCYGREVYRMVSIPTEWGQFLPEQLTTSPFWGDF